MAYTKIDKDIMHIIGARQLTATDIATKSGYGRTTINYRLKKLQSLRLAKRSAVVGKKVYFSLNRGAINQSKKSKVIEIFTGLQFVHAYNYFLEVPRQTIIYSIQGQEAVKKIFGVLPSSFIKDFNKTQKRKNILLKGFVNEKTPQVLRLLNRGLLESQEGRAVGLKVIKGDLFLGPCELFCSPKTLLLSNVGAKRALIIKDKRVVELLYETLSLLYNISDNVESFSINKYLQGLLSGQLK